MKRLLVLSLLLAITGLASAQSSKIAPELRGLRASDNVDVIVQFVSPISGADRDELRDDGIKVKRHLGLVRSLALRVKARNLEQIASSSRVRYIWPDRPVNNTLDHVAATTGATSAWNLGWTGAGVGVAIIDSGIASRGDFDTRVVYSESFLPSGSSSHDEYGHGTHVAGIVGSAGLSSNGKFKGVAPGAKLLNLRVLDKYGAGYDSSVIAAIERAVELKSQYNVRVINLSLGRRVFESCSQDLLCQAVEEAWKQDIVVVVAAGNYGRDNSLKTKGYGMITSPGNSPYVITVGSTRMMRTDTPFDDLIASYSSKGPTLIDHIVKPDLVAPGTNVESVVAPDSYLANRYPRALASGYLYTDTSGDPAPDYMMLSGTSMATPVVTGAVALMLQKDPNLKPDQVKARLMKTASKQFGSMYSISNNPVSGVNYFNQHDIFAVGAGYLNIPAALANTDYANGPALSPIAVYDPVTRTVRLVFQDGSGMSGSSVIWGTSVIWGYSVVWGTNVFVGSSSVLWGSSVVWGTSLDEGFSVIWGTSVVWGNSVLWGSSEAMSVTIDGEE